MKKIYLFLALLINVQLYAEFPVVVKHNNSSNINVRTGPSTSNSIITSVAPNKKMVAIAESNGWYKINIPTDNVSIPTYGWVAGGSGYFQPVNNEDYIELTGNDVIIRKNAGGSSNSTTVVWINNGTTHEYATTSANQYFSFTNTTSINGTTWYRIDLPNNCRTYNGSTYSNRTYGWLNGNYIQLHNTNNSNADPAVDLLYTFPDNVVVGERIKLKARISNEGSADITSPVHLEYFIDGNYIDDDDINNGDLPFAPGNTEVEYIYYTFNSTGTYHFCVALDNHPQETNFTNNNGCIDIVVNNQSCTGVTITQQPTNQTVTSGNSATFSVTASGTSPFSYQWKKNGSNISGATSSTYTTPSLSLSNNNDQYRCSITNCSGNYSAISNIAYLTINTTSSDVRVFNVIGNNQFSDKLLWSLGDINPVKICADGSSATEIEFINNTSVPNSDIGFKLASQNTDGDLYGTFQSPDVFVDDSGVVVKYNHPDFLNIGNQKYITDNIIIYNTIDSQTLETIPIKIYRAPVLMVHGLWGTENSFNGMDYYLKTTLSKYPNILTKKVGYESSFDVSFIDNKNVIPININRFITNLRNANFSVKKVNVVCHSMGGLLTRKYIQSYKFFERQNILKFITINTPHSGSPWGNILFNPNYGWLLRPIANAIVKRKVHPNANVNNGAVEDLSINSPAMNSLNGSSLNYNMVKSHTITTSIFDINDNVLYGLHVVSSSFTNLAFPDFLNRLFDYNSHDGIVSLKSQSGGLVGNASNLNPTHNKHVGAQNNFEVKNKVDELLDLNLNSSQFSTHFAPINITPHYRQTSNATSSTYISGSITINSPIDNQYFNPGQTISVDVTSSNGINKIVFIGVSNSQTPQTVETVNSNNYTFNYIIPVDAYDKFSIIVAGFNSQNEGVDYDIVDLNINNTSTINNIEFYQDELMIPDNYVSSIGIKAIRSNGIIQDITGNPDITYSINNTSIANHYFGSYIKGNTAGTTILTATYQGLSINIPIIVYQGDGTVIELPSTLAIIENQIDNNKNLLDIFPNPNDGNFTIQLETNQYKDIDIKVYNSTGKELLNLKEKSNNSIFIKEISLKNYSNGIYFIKVINGNKTNVGKLIISK